MYFFLSIWNKEYYLLIDVRGYSTKLFEMVLTQGTDIIVSFDF